MSERQIIRVRDVMLKEFDVIDGMLTIDEAIKSMRHVEAKALIVNKRHDDDEYGLLLISDIARKVLATDRSPDRVNVYEVMAKPVITVDPNMNIRYCARLFERFSITRTPVVENGKVIGIVSFTDLVLNGLCKSIQ
jgi:signal-transduction protein with cAMP-binding, CBS, and nucleotidyltransferase domain